MPKGFFALNFLIFDVASEDECILHAIQNPEVWLLKTFQICTCALWAVIVHEQQMSRCYYPDCINVLPRCVVCSLCFASIGFVFCIVLCLSERSLQFKKHS
jgi:hypothetical protein